MMLSTHLIFGIATSVCLTIFSHAAHAQQPTQPLAKPTMTNPANSKTTLNQTAKGTFVVKLQPLGMEGQPAGSTLNRMSIDKQISGDLVAMTTGQMLSAMTQTKGSAGYVAIERVEGTLHGRKGSFVLQHNGIMNRGAPSLTVSVVPDSGTDELAGISGEFKMIIADGKHSYEFTYSLS
jgi:Protein of unknown function (DUF3224)